MHTAGLLCAPGRGIAASPQDCFGFAPGDSQAIPYLSSIPGAADFSPCANAP